jgi:RimJ/RimL family protein N-acetyltransferase
MSTPSIEPITFIQGRSLSLAPLSFAHISLYLQWFNDFLVRRYGRSEFPRTEEEIRKQITESGKDHNYISMEIWHILDKKPIGIVSLHHIEWPSRIALIGLEIGDKSYWKHGYGSEAAELIVNYGFNELNMHKISAAIFSANLGSQGCAKKIGMKLEARLKDTIFIDGHYYDDLWFSIFQDEWFQMHPPKKYT